MWPKPRRHSRAVSGALDAPPGAARVRLIPLISLERVRWVRFDYPIGSVQRQEQIKFLSSPSIDRIKKRTHRTHIIHFSHLVRTRGAPFAHPAACCCPQPGLLLPPTRPAAAPNPVATASQGPRRGVFESRSDPKVVRAIKRPLIAAMAGGGKNLCNSRY